jgi:hypothetical protein
VTGGVFTPPFFVCQKNNEHILYKNLLCVVNVLYIRCINTNTKHTIMTRTDIKQTIIDLTKCYLLSFGIPEEPTEMAIGYWDLRIDDEIERDTKAGVTFEDYDMWVRCTVADFQTNIVLNKFKHFLA